MNLVYQSLLEPSSITHSVSGNFLGKKVISLVLVRGSQLIELQVQNLETGKFTKFLELQPFSQIRRVSEYKVIGNEKDYLIVCSDSGVLVILEFFHENQKYSFKTVISETYCKTGCRRVSQGFFITCDLKGRGILLSSLEKNKIMFLTKFQKDKLEISSPVEANVFNNICFDIQALDVGFENPLFVTLEANYGNKDDQNSTLFTNVVQKQVTIYEMDLSLNNMVIKKIIKVSEDSTKLLPMKNLFVLIRKKCLICYNINGEVQWEVIIPQRIESLKKDIEISLLTFTYFKHKKFEFWILQNSLGDLFKLTESKIEYICTTKISTSIHLLKSGYLFLANESFDHQIFSVENFIGQSDRQIDTLYFPISIEDLDNFKNIQSITNLQGLIDLKYIDLQGDELGQYYSIVSGVNGSRLIKMKKGIQFEQMAHTQLPVNAQKIWCLNKIQSRSKDLTEMIVLAMEEGLVILQAGEQISKYKEKTDFIMTQKTIHIIELQSNDIVIGYSQITSNKIRTITGTNQYEDIEIETSNINYCDFQDNKLVIYTQEKELICYQWFEGRFQFMKKLKLEKEALCLKILKKETKRVSNSLLAVGLTDSTLRVFSLEPENILMQLSIQVLSQLPEVIADLDNYIFVSYINGDVYQSLIEKQTGILKESKNLEFHTNKSLKLFQIEDEDINGIIFSGKNQILFEKDFNGHKFQSMLLPSNDQIVSMSVLKSKFGQDCIIYITVDNVMKIIRKSENIDFAKEEKELPLMGKKLMIDLDTLSLIVLQSQPRTLNPNEREIIYRNISEFIQENDLQDKKDLLQKNLIKYEAEINQWQSQISVINPVTLKTIMEYKFEKENYHLVTAQMCQFKEVQEENFLVVSLVQDFHMKKQTFNKSLVTIFSLDLKNKQFNSIHTTYLDDICYSIAQFQGRILLGVGGYLRLFSFGKKQLLLKSEFKHKYQIINNIRIIEDRIFITDAVDSVHLIKYNEKTNQFYELADDLLPRYSVALELLDYHSAILSDKFGNLTIQRIPQNSEKEYTEDFISYRFTWETGYLNGAPVKFDEVMRFYQVNLVTQLQRVILYRNQQTMVLFTDIAGRIGCLLPLEFKNQIDYFIHLQMVMREEFENFTDRDHLVFRSQYGSCIGVIDFDLCLQFKTMTQEKQKKIAEKLESSVEEVMQMLLLVNFKSF